MGAFTCFASVSFGLSSVVKRELLELGARDVKAGDARVYFTAGEETLMRANLCLRCADRVYIELARFSAASFEELYSGVRGVGLKDYIGKNDAFPVTADSVRSKLKSVSDIQSVAKKAAVDALIKAHGVNTLPENGGMVRLHVFIIGDEASLCINASGEGLNRRGYRTSTTLSPIRETLAAGVVSLCGYRGGPFIDPMCGGGTLAIEAYLMAMGIPPGLNRPFDMERFGFISVGACRRARDEARFAPKPVDPPEITASDIDGEAVRFARAHAKKAGAKISFKVANALCLDYSKLEGALACNPPYAVRMGQRDEARKLYREMGLKLEGSRLKQGFICADDEFERWFGRRAYKKRKLYNGGIRCNLYIY